MSASTIFFLFAIVAGHGDAASLSTLGEFKDNASCSVAQSAVTTALKGSSTEIARVFCASSDAVKGLADAAR